MSDAQVRSMCCNAEFEMVDGGFRWECTGCHQEVPTKDWYPYNDNCPGSFTYNYVNTDNQYVSICGVCGGEGRAGVKGMGRHKPHDPPRSAEEGVEAFNDRIAKLMADVEVRRNSPEAQRMRARMAEDKVILDRLANNDWREP